MECVSDMAYSKKPKFVEIAPPKGRSLVYYLGAFPWKGLALPGVLDEGDFVADGMTAYDFERVDPSNKMRYAIVDMPQHLLFFAIHKDGDNARPYQVKPTASHRKLMEKLQAQYIVDNQTGHLKSRKDVAQLESDLDALLAS